MKPRHGYEKLSSLFLKRVSAKNENGCILWNEKSGSDWYGTFRMGDKLVKSHRASYIMFVGDIKDMEMICHKCDIKNCVNPDHLFAASHTENMRDMHRKGRWITGNFGGHLKLTRAQADEIYADQRTHNLIAREYGVSRCTVSGIKNNKTWKRYIPDTSQQAERIRFFADRIKNETIPSDY
jgi:hypothetical protein